MTITYEKIGPGGRWEPGKGMCRECGQEVHQVEYLWYHYFENGVPSGYRETHSPIPEGRR